MKVVQFIFCQFTVLNLFHSFTLFMSQVVHLWPLRKNHRRRSVSPSCYPIKTNFLLPLNFPTSRAFVRSSRQKRYNFLIHLSKQVTWSLLERAISVKLKPTPFSFPIARAYAAAAAEKHPHWKNEKLICIRRRKKEGELASCPPCSSSQLDLLPKF